ncbi:unnamed protein product [Arabidopsis thaliana]|uniref:(thale cress) hypothetical protein n=1 Tax=Arabidopsis thaliana TaxID=3702 RepID=A0A7G2DX73_ARATH|nr:unnamed protein product [Arabidopsis thaliana]
MERGLVKNLGNGVEVKVHIIEEGPESDDYTLTLVKCRGNCMFRGGWYNMVKAKCYKPDDEIGLIFISFTSRVSNSTEERTRILLRRKMKLLRRRFFNSVNTITRPNRRHYATKYVAKVTSSSPSGRSLSAEVSLPNPLPADVRGYPLPRRHLICRATNLITGASNLSDAFSDLSDYLSSLSLSLTPDEASEILKSLNSPLLAVEFFKLVPSLCPYSQNDPFLYNRIILILSRSNLPDRFDRVRSILDSMVKSNVHGNISTVNILIGFFGNTEDLQMCLRLVKKWDLKMNSFTYKCLLQAYLRSRDYSKAFDVYCEIRRGGHKLDIFAYNMLLDALAKDEKPFVRLIRLVKTMGRIGKCDEAVGLFNEMITEGLTLNVVGYNTLMQVLAKGKMVDKAIQVFSRMVETGCRPNEYTYSLVLNLLVAEGQLVRLDGVVEISKRYMTQGIYSYLVRTLSKLGHVSEAHRLFCDMWSFPVKGERDSYMSMLESLCGAGKTIEAIEMLSKIHEKGVVTDTMMYNTVFSALGKLKQISHIHDLFEKMKKDEAVDLYSKMKQQGLTPDSITYTVLERLQSGSHGKSRIRRKNPITGWVVSPL